MGPWRVRDGGFPRLGALASDPPAPALASLELVALVVVIGACVVMQGFTATRGAVKYGGADHASFQRLRRRYNIVYTLGTFGDWIQGAYLYALYREHGFDMADIGYIFVLGYFASATVGTYVASLGDVYGHRRLVMLYGTLYGVACVLMRSSDVTALLASRVLSSGVAYSLLFSSFESWAISEVDRLRLDRRYLVPLFSTATFFNAVSAVAAGVVGNLAVEYFNPRRRKRSTSLAGSRRFKSYRRLRHPRPRPSSSRALRLRRGRGAARGNAARPHEQVRTRV